MAGLLVIISAIPQLFQSLVTKSTKDVSSSMCLLLDMSLIFWIYYGVRLKDFPIIFTNVVCLTIWGIITYLKFLYG